MPSCAWATAWRPDEGAMTLVRVAGLSVSLDGCGALRTVLRRPSPTR